MTSQIHPLRSVLYMPGSNLRALEKGRDLDCDAIIMDLEDAVAPEQKALARTQVAEALAEGGYGHRRVAVRINGLDSDWGAQDLEMAQRSEAQVIVLPKVENTTTIQHVAKYISSKQRLWAMIETPLGVLNAREIAVSDKKLECLVMGTSDLARELRCAHTPDRAPFLTAFGLCILAARACGLSILDGVHLDLADDAGFAASCRQALELGFDGKTLIHPKTIAVANQVFAPSADQLTEAHEIIAAYRVAQKKGAGVVVVNGKLIENLHVEMAGRLLELQAALDERNQ